MSSEKVPVVTEQDPRKKTEEYIERHHIHLLLESILAQVMFFKPQDPKQFIAEYLEKLKTGAAEPLVSTADLRAIFCMFDITKRGCITREQASNALKTIVGPAGALKYVDAENELPQYLNEGEFVQSMTLALQSALPTRVA